MAGGRRASPSRVCASAWSARDGSRHRAVHEPRRCAVAAAPSGGWRQRRDACQAFRMGLRVHHGWLRIKRSEVSNVAANDRAKGLLSDALDELSRHNIRRAHQLAEEAAKEDSRVQLVVNMTCQYTPRQSRTLRTTSCLTGEGTATLRSERGRVPPATRAARRSEFPAATLVNASVLLQAEGIVTTSLGRVLGVGLAVLGACNGKTSGGDASASLAMPPDGRDASASSRRRRRRRRRRRVEASAREPRVGTPPRWRLRRDE